MAKQLGPNGEALPPGISWDAKKRRYRVRGRHGGKTLADAKRKLRELARGIDRRSYTLAQYVERWAADQERKGRRSWERAVRQLELHALPVLGNKPLAEVTASEIVDLGWNVYQPGVFGAKSVDNLRGTLSSVYSRAVFEGLIDVNPVKMIPRGELPKVGDNPWPAYEPTDVAALLSNERIPSDRRILYACAFFFAVRIGEACGFRFSDWDQAAKPLGAMAIDKQYEGAELKGARDDYKAERRFPVAPAMAAFLGDWWSHGFEERYGRPPRRDDFISPYPRTMGAKTLSKADHDMYADRDAVGIEPKPGLLTHGLRKCWITMAHEAGANREAVRVLTHSGKSRDQLDDYVRWTWPALCEAVELVKLPTPAQIISLEDYRA